MDAAARASHVRASLPEGGLFAGHDWRITPEPFPLGAKLAKQLQSLGKKLQRFYQATDLLYRHSIEGKQPTWVHQWLDQGKPAEIIELQRHPAFKSALPRVIRPDILLTKDGWSITELDSVPGGIGLTAWLNETYSQFSNVIGGKSGMLDGFSSIFDGDHPKIIVSEESKTYRPEMEWLTSRNGSGGSVVDEQFSDWEDGNSVYRFFELFDLPNLPNAIGLLDGAKESRLNLTPPPKSFLEEKMVFALLHNRNLREFWLRELGGKFFRELSAAIPRTWVMDPTPLSPHAAYPGLELTDWRQLGELSQKDRQFVLKLSGFNERAWGSRSVRMGPDLSQADWAQSVDEALVEFGESPWILQRYAKPRRAEHAWFDFDSNQTMQMTGRVRLCPYYFVNDEAKVLLGGVLATFCPADKKIIHGMKDAILAPCAANEN